jgi:glycerol-3-phosphate acyltransferase PlsY
MDILKAMATMKRPKLGLKWPIFSDFCEGFGVKYTLGVIVLVLDQLKRFVF